MGSSQSGLDTDSKLLTILSGEGVICGSSSVARVLLTFRLMAQPGETHHHLSCVSVFSFLQSGQDGSSQRPTPTRIPMSKGMKAGKPVVAAPGAGNLTKFEPRAETQSMKIELKKSAAGSATSLGGGKG